MKKNLLNLKTMVMALAILFSGAAKAFTAVTSGNWSSAATWGGVAPGSTVTNADIIIPTGITVTFDTDVTFSGLLNSFSVAGTLSSSTNNQLIITQGVFSGIGTVAIRRITFSGTATASFAGTLNVKEMVNGTSSLAFVAVANISDSLILEAGTLALNANSNLSLLTNATIKVSNGILGVTGGVLNVSNNYNVMYVGMSKVTGPELNSVTIQNLTLKMNSNSESITLANNTTVNNNLTLNAGKLNFAGKNLILKGDLMMSGSAALVSDATSDLEIQGSGALTSNLVFTGSVINNMTLNRATTIKLSSALNVAGSLNMMNGTLSLESGSSITMNVGSKVHVEGGNIVLNSGNFTGTAAYNVEYMGAANSSGGVELSGSGLNDLTVNYTNASSKVLLTNSATIAGNLKMMSGNVDLNGQNITLNGTLTQNATGNAGFIGNPSSEMNLNLTSASNTTLYFNSATAVNQTLSKLKMNVSGTTALALGSVLVIKNELSFVKGKLLLDNSDLIMQSTASITGFDNSNYIATTGTGSGRLQMNVTSGSSFVTFPVGTLSNYSPAFIQQTSSATSGNIMVKAMGEILTGGNAGLPQTTLPSVARTWFIEAESGVNVNMNLKLGWVAAAEVNGFNRANAMIRHYTSGAWDTSVGASATAGANGTFELTRSGITSLSPFAVVDNTAPLNVKELTNSVEFELYPNPAKDFITLKVSSGTYKYELIDVTGRTVYMNQKTGNSANFDVSDLQPGYYFIKATNLADNANAVKRFIKD